MIRMPIAHRTDHNDLNEGSRKMSVTVGGGRFGDEAAASARNRQDGTGAASLGKREPAR